MGGENKRRYTSRDGYAEQDRKAPHITHLRLLSLSFQDYCCKQAIALTTWSGWVRILGGSRQSPDNPLQLNADFAILRTADLGCWRDQGLRSLRRQCVQPAWRHP